MYDNISSLGFFELGAVLGAAISKNGVIVVLIESQHWQNKSIFLQSLLCNLHMHPFPAAKLQWKAWRDNMIWYVGCCFNFRTQSVFSDAVSYTCMHILPLYSKYSCYVWLRLWLNIDFWFLNFINHHKMVI